MAPTERKMTTNKSTARDGNWKKSQSNKQGFKKKKWTPDNKVFEGSVKEGQGFAFKRKEKVRHEYNKLLRKERRKNPESKAVYAEEYPEHLRHLYLAEAKKLKQEAWTNRVNRSKMRMKGQEVGEDVPGNGDDDDHDDDDEDDDVTPQQTTEAADQDLTSGSEQVDSVTGNDHTAASPEKESLPLSNRMRKKMQMKTSYQKTKEDFEKLKETQKNKKEEYLKSKQQRAEAIEKYKQKKMEKFQVLSKKTKKGQPNLNLQMDYLLQKIQGTGK